MITGSLVALVTPMHQDGSLDWQHLDSLIDFHLENGTDAIVAVGTTGESATLDPTEHCKVIAHVVSRVGGRIKVIAGTGANATKEAIELTRAAKEHGADACLLVTPYYNKPTQEGMYLHYRTIAEAVDIEQILYNVPGRTSVDLLNETVNRLADIPNIVGVKDATGDLTRGKQLIEMVSDRMAVYSGDDATAVELMLMGAKGNISVTANIAPKRMAGMCACAIQGEAEQARKLNDELMTLHKNLFLESNPIPVKWALYELGRVEPGIRLPLTPLAEKFRNQLKQSLHDSGLIEG
jgi:4-hydroxy-tetrahydrodipicolinate synthase